jgi:hypothetical protein
MRQFFPFFFLLIISLNALVPLLEQLQGEDLFELAEFKVDGVDDEGEKEKEKYEKEATVPVTVGHSLKRYAFELLILKKALFPTNPLPDSGLFTPSPDLPPEA